MMRFRAVYFPLVLIVLVLANRVSGDERFHYPEAKHGKGELRYIQESPRSVETVRQEPAWQTVEASDATSCRIEGKNLILVYPRSVGRQSAFLFEGSRLTVSTKARAVYLRLPTVFATPGPRYSDFADARLRIRIDERPWQEIVLATARQEWPSVEDLPPGEHRVVVEPVGTMAAVDGFRFAPEPLSCLLGTIVASGYSELLTDVRAEVFSEGKRVRMEYVRSPLTGNFELWGLASGTYKLRITASGWLPHEVPEIVIRRPGQHVDLGTIAVTRDPRCGGRDIQNRDGHVALSRADTGNHSLDSADRRTHLLRNSGGRRRSCAECAS